MFHSTNAHNNMRRADPPIIHVDALRLLTTAGNLKAFARVSYDGTTVSDVRIVQQPGQRAWVQPPQREYTRDGQRCYAPLVRWTPDLADAISTAVLSAYERATHRTSDPLFGVEGGAQ